MTTLGMACAVQEDVTGYASSSRRARRLERASGQDSALVTMDHHLVQADFIGTVDVTSIKEPSRGVVPVTLQPVDIWYSRSDTRDAIEIGISENHWGEFRTKIIRGARLLVTLSGGPWEISPFPDGRHSIFVVNRDGTVSCDPQVTLFAVNLNGFFCSIQPYQAAPPATLGTLRVQLTDARNHAASRLSPLDARLSSLHRRIEANPTPSASIDRTLPENEVWR